MDLYDPEQFTPASGIWHIIARDAAGDPESILRSVLTGTATGGRSYVVAFTDSDLAERFIERHTPQGWLPFPVLNQQAWLLFLNDLREIGHEYIGFDPEPGGKFADFGTIAEAIARVGEAQRDP